MTMDRAGRRENFRTLVTLALPIVLEEILSTLLQYVDTAMVGRLGADATASVSLTSTVNWLIYSLFSSFGIAVVAVVSTALGARDTEKIRKASSMAFTVSILAGITVAVAAIALSPFIPVWMNASTEIRESASLYFAIISAAIPFRSFIIIGSSVLRAVKDSKTPMLINLSANILNIGLNYLFIYTLSLGVKGAAVATLISYACGAAALAVIWRRKKEVSCSLRYLKPDRAVLSETVKIALPAAATNTTSCLGHIVFASLVSSMGTIIFAAHSIALSAETIFYVPGYGLRGATSTLIGISVGEKDEEKFRIIEQQSTVITIVMMAFTGALLFFSAHTIMGFFTPEEEVIREGTGILRLIAFTEPLFGLMIVSEGIYYGLGETKFTFIIETIGAWGIRILFSTVAIKVLNTDLLGVWVCMALDNTFRALGLSLPILFRRGTRLFRKKAGIGTEETAT